MGNESEENVSTDNVEQKPNTRGVGGMFGMSTGMILLTAIHFFSGLPGWVYFILLLPVIYFSALIGNWIQEKKDD